MTKVQIHFEFETLIEDAMAMRLSDVNSVYGIERIQLDPDMKGITVEYDASRLKPDEVRSVLEGVGLAVHAN